MEAQFPLISPLPLSAFHFGETRESCGCALPAVRHSNSALHLSVSLSMFEFGTWETGGTRCRIRRIKAVAGRATWATRFRSIPK